MELTYKQIAEQELREIAQRITLLENQLEKEPQDRLSEFQGITLLENQLEKERQDRLSEFRGIRLEFAGLRTDLKSQCAELDSLQGRISNVTVGSTVAQDYNP